MPDARAVCDVGGLSRYSGFVLDASTGEWSVYANETAALLSYLPAATGQLNEMNMACSSSPWAGTFGRACCERS